MSSPYLSRRVRHVHMVGIGGAGMSGIAEVLLNLGFQVTGSDMQSSEITGRLTQLGARIFEGHAAENVNGADALVYSSAIQPDNAELLAARSLRIPVIPRSEMLAELMRLKTGMAVAGTHGKTTTTSMIGAILQRAGMNPTLIVGGIVRALQSGVKMGSGELLVVEADEFDRSFLKLSPTFAVITTIEPEHLDTYTDLDGIKEAFVEFANKVPFYGSLVVCGDDSNILSILPRVQRHVVTYGVGTDCMIRAEDIQFRGHFSSFVAMAQTSTLGSFELQMPGHHNILNALAAISAASELGIPMPAVRDALADFTGVRRRFEIKGESDGVIVVDDYAHHPTEVYNTLRTAHICWPDRRIVALFQPHLFSRTRDFAAEFGKALAQADAVLLTDIYPSRERPIPGVTSELIAQSARESGVADLHLIGNEDLVSRTRRLIKSGDALIVMGAGSITRVAQELANPGS